MIWWNSDQWKKMMFYLKFDLGLIGLSAND